MALNSSTLSTILQANIASLGVTEPAKNKDFCDALASGIVSHITTSGQVNAGIPVATTGTPTNHTGVTTAPGTIA